MHRINWIIAVVAATVSLTAVARTIVPIPPAQPDPSARYLFYLHGKGIDDGSASARAPYRRSVEALSELGFVVVSEMRPTGSIRKFPDDHEKYARKIAAEVRQLLDAGVPARNIFVAGYSRGGTLVLMISSLVANAELNYVVIAGCVSGNGAYARARPTIHERYAPGLKGRFLSLRDRADEDFGSCASYFEKTSGPITHQEITLSTGEGHMAFQEPSQQWLQPLGEWARRD